MSISSKIDKITTVTEDRRHPILTAPRSVKIELTGRCNFKCSFCARSSKLREQKEMAWPLFVRLLMEMHAAGVKEIGLFYLGESFMDKRLTDAIKLCKDIGFEYVFLTTNGSLASPEKLRAVFTAGLDSLKFSLNYADEAQFLEIARVKGTMYHDMLENMQAASAIRDRVEVETGHRCGLYASYIQYDGEQGVRMTDVVNLMKPYLDEIYPLPLYGQAGPQESPMKDGKMVPTGGNTGRLENPVPALPCWATINEGHITWDGQMSACCWDHNSGLSMADLTKVSFMEGWNSDKFQQLRAAHLSGDVHNTPCEGCIYGSKS